MVRFWPIRKHRKSASNAGKSPPCFRDHSEEIDAPTVPQSHRRRVIHLTLGFLCVAVSAQDKFETPKKVTSIEGITEYRLPNGLRVLLFPDPTRPKLTVNLTVLVGSRHEGYGETGMAHLLEHMLFKGTPTHPNIPGA